MKFNQEMCRPLLAYFFRYFEENSGVMIVSGVLVVLLPASLTQLQSGGRREEGDREEMRDKHCNFLFNRCGGALEGLTSTAKVPRPR